MRGDGDAVDVATMVAERAPITYVAEQLGHANASTTLRYYARWIPSKGRRWADLLDRVATAVRDTVMSAAEGLAEALGSKLGTRIWNQNGTGDPDALEVPGCVGGPSRTRTLDPLIKSETQGLRTGTYGDASARDSEGW